MRRAVWVAWVVLAVACGGSRSNATAADGGKGPASSAADGGGPTNAYAGDAGVTTYGQTYSGGQFHLGPVDWDQTQWPNACAPPTKYSATVRQLEGQLLAGLWKGIPNVAGYCDACVHVTTERGKSATLRIVTFGDTTDNSLDVSPAAYTILNSGEYPRAMTWQFAKCPDTGAIVYEFQTAASEWWTSFWVRNARVPLAKVEVKAAKHDYSELERRSDGTLLDGGGFGQGAFSIRLTAVDGQQLVHEFAWPASGLGGATLNAPGNFD